MQSTTNTGTAMGFRFRRRIKILPGIHLNVSRSGVSASVGRRGASMTVGKRGTTANVGLPGTGLSYTKTLGTGKKQRTAKAETPALPPLPTPAPSSTGRSPVLAAVVLTFLGTLLLVWALG